MSDTRINVLITASNQAQSTIDQLVKGIQDLQTSFAKVNVEAGKSDVSAPLEKTAASAKKTGDAVEKTADAHKKAGAAAKEHSGWITVLGEAFEAANKRFGSLAFGLQAAVSTFAAFEAVKLTHEVTELADRVAVLNVALGVLSTNAGLPREEVLETAEAIEKLGFDASDARENLAKLVQVGIDPGTFGVALAKAAQDLSIIAGKTSGQTFTQLVQAVETGRTLMLRRLGIVVDETEVLKEAEAKYGVVLDDTAKKQIVLSAVLEQAAKVSGLYQANVNSLQVQQELLRIALEDSSEAIGKKFRPAVVALTQVFRQLLDSFRELKEGNHELTEAEKLLGVTQEDLNQSASTTAKVIHAVGDAIVGIFKFLNDHRVILKTILEIYIAYKVVPIIISAVGTAIEFMAAKAVLATGIVDTLTASMTAYNLANKAAVVGEVASGIGALGAAAGKAAPVAEGLFARVLASRALGNVANLAIGIGSLGVALAGLSAAAAVAAAPFVAFGAILAGVGVLAYKAYEGIYGDKNRAKETADAFDAYNASLVEQTQNLNRVATQSGFLRDAQDQLTTAQLKGDKSGEEAAKKRVETIQKLLEGAEADLGRSNEAVKARALEAAAADKVSKATDEQIKKVKELQEAQSQSDRLQKERDARNVDLALKDLGFDSRKQLQTGIDPKVTRQLAEVGTLFKEVGKDTDGAGESVESLVAKVEELGTKIKSQAGLNLFEKNVDGYIEELKKQGQTNLIPALQAAVQSARDAVAKSIAETNLGGAVASARTQEQFKQQLQTSLDTVKAQSEAARDTIVEQQKSLDAAFQQSLVSIQSYYAEKGRLQAADAAAAKRVSDAEIANLSNQLARADQFGLNQQQQDALRIQIRQKEQAAAQVEAKNQQTALANDIARTEALRKLNVEREKSNAELLAQTGDTFGSQVALLRIDQQEKIRTLQAQIESDRARNDAAAVAAGEADLEVQTRIYGIKVQSIAADQKLAQIGLARSRADQDEALAQTQFDNFQSNRQDYEQKLNDLSAARVQYAKDELAVLQDKIRTQPLSIELQNQESQKIQEIITLQSKQLQQFRETANAINSSFQSSVENFLDLVVNQGKRVGESLRSSLSGFLQDINKAIFKQVSGDLARSIGDIGGLLTGQATAGNEGGFGGFINSIRSALGVDFKPGQDKKVELPKPVASFDDESKNLLKQSILSKNTTATGEQGKPYYVTVTNPAGAVNQPPGAPKITKDAEDQQKGTAPAPVQPIAPAATTGQLVVKNGDKDPGNDQLTKNEVTEIAAKQGLTPDQQALLLAIYQRESSSGADPRALTPGVNGAVGGFQFIPSTFEETRRKAGLPAGDILEPEDQAQTAAILIKNLSEKFNGDATKVAAAYLGGSGVIDSAGMIKVKFDGLGTSTVDYARQVATSAEKIKANATVTDGDTTATTKGTTATDADTAALVAHRQALEVEADALLKSAGTTTATPGAGLPSQSTEDLQAAAAAELPDDGSNARDQLLSRGENTGGSPSNPVYVSAAPTSPTTTGIPNPSNLVAASGTDPFGGVFSKLATGLGGLLGGALGGKLGGTTGTGVGGILGTLLGANAGKIASGLGSLFGGGPSQSTKSLQEAAAKELGGDDPLKASGLLDAKSGLTDFFGSMKDTFSEGLDSLGGLISGSGSSLSSFFSSFGSTISDFFSSLSDSGGDSGGGGGWISAVGDIVGSFFAEGGPVSGAGTGTSDSIPAMLSHGEYVMTAEKTAQYLPILEMMRLGNFDLRSMFAGLGNSRTFAPVKMSTPRSGRYAEGGLVQSIAGKGGAQGDSTAPVVNINIDASGNQKTGTDSSNQNTGIDKFAGIMASVARKTILEEQRPGGSLNQATA